MRLRIVSSGDPVADNRLRWADGLFADGDPSGAAALLAEVLPAHDGWAAGWYRLGEYLAAAGKPDEAARAWDRAIEADPADRLGATLRRDLLRRSPLGDTMPSAFVEALFDAYAPEFDASLARLGYRGPDLVAGAVTRGGAAARALDLGCGTGLLGEALRPMVDVLEGIDISAEMLALAEARGCYDRLEKADLQELAPPAPRYDLIAAADVVMYLGGLERLVGWIAGALHPGGRFVFTAEALEGEGFRLGEARRYRHSETYLRELLSAAGFEDPRIERATVRHDRGAPVEALVVATALAATRPDRAAGGRALESDPI